MRCPSGDQRGSAYTSSGPLSVRREIWCVSASTRTSVERAGPSCTAMISPSLRTSGWMTRALDVEVGANDAGLREVELREEVAAARHRHARAARVATAEARAPPRRRDEVRRVGLAPVAA